MKRVEFSHFVSVILIFLAVILLMVSASPVSYGKTDKTLSGKTLDFSKELRFISSVNIHDNSIYSPQIAGLYDNSDTTIYLSGLNFDKKGTLAHEYVHYLMHTHHYSKLDDVLDVDYNEEELTDIITYYLLKSKGTDRFMYSYLSKKDIVKAYQSQDIKDMVNFYLYLEDTGSDGYFVVLENTVEQQ